MDKYINNRKENWLYFIRYLNGILIFASLILFNSNFVNDNLLFLYIFCLFAVSYLIETLVKLITLKKCNNQIITINKFYLINKLYEKYINDENKKYIKTNILNTTKKNKELIINYLIYTKTDLYKLSFKEIIMTALSFIVGASFTDNGKIDHNSLSNAAIYTAALFLSAFIFYSILFKIINNYKLIMNHNVIKHELLKYIIEMEYDEIVVQKSEDIN